MKRLNIVRPVLIGLAAAGITSLLPLAIQTVTAANTNAIGTGVVEIVQEIDVGCPVTLDFGRLLPPAGATGIWYMDVKENGELEIMGVGSDSVDPDKTDHHLGECLIVGGPNEEVKFTIAITNNFSAFGYNLLNLKTLPKSPVTISADGQVNVKVGGRLQIEHASPGINGGGEPAVFTLTVNF